MGKIKILEERLIDKIAAGEVVERPASVVKELIENSIDSNASSIEIVVSEGGKKSIRVSDDGEGMDKDDLILAFDRHATSKIFKENDLFSITTMGFRGEAVPSIASVSSMQLRSGITFKAPGNEISVHGGTISKVHEVAPLKGTIATIHSLFYNTPARRKFLKSEKTELSHIVTWVQNSALSFCNKRFRLNSYLRVIFNLSPVQKRIDRISQIFGVELARKLIRFDGQGKDFSIEGYLSKPGEGLRNRSSQRFFVNGRPVKDRLLSRSTWQAYKEFFPATHPVLFLFMSINPSLIDVNVHPTKMEIRFFHPFIIQDVLQHAIRSAVLKTPEIPSMTIVSSKPDQNEMPTERPSVEAEYHQKQFVEPSSHISLAEQDFDRFQIIGQHKDTFIIASEKEDLVIIDQHIAHERVLFDEIKRQIEGGGVQKQKLIFPLTVECAPAESAWLDSNRKMLERTGIHLEHFGKHTYKVENVPSILPIDSVAEMIKEMASEPSSTSPPEEEVSRIAATLACHSAIKSGSKLDHAKMEYILKLLLQSSNPYYCPHGRPIMMRIDSSTLKKKFQRSF